MRKDGLTLCGTARHFESGEIPRWRGAPRSCPCCGIRIRSYWEPYKDNVMCERCVAPLHIPQDVNKAAAVFLKALRRGQFVWIHQESQLAGLTRRERRLVYLKVEATLRKEGKSLEAIRKRGLRIQPMPPSVELDG